MLTRKQIDLLGLIHRRMDSDGVAPSFDEMKDALDLRSKSGIHRLITALEERGFIRRLPHRARAIEVLKLPDALTALAENPDGTGTGAAVAATPPAAADDRARQHERHPAGDGAYRRRHPDRGDQPAAARHHRARDHAARGKPTTTRWKCRAIR